MNTQTLNKYLKRELARLKNANSRTHLDNLKIIAYRKLLKQRE